MIELTLSITALFWCAWALYQCRRNRRAIDEESDRLLRLKQALLTHQAAPNPHGPSPWDLQNPL